MPRLRCRRRSFCRYGCLICSPATANHGAAFCFSARQEQVRSHLCTMTVIVMCGRQVLPGQGCGNGGQQLHIHIGVVVGSRVQVAGTVGAVRVAGQLVECTLSHVCLDRLVKALFDIAREKKPCIIFVDEVCRASLPWCVLTPSPGGLDVLNAIRWSLLDGHARMSH